ncbi:MAG: AbgT family transporter [Eubacteriaceae bacterium]|nr:AbgT family transporter [Eubacteriaceae bacterium]
MSNGPKIEGKKKFNLPHIYVILFGIIVLCTILTWIVPAGNFDRIENEAGRMVVVAGTWHAVDATPVGPFKMFMCIFDGACDAASIAMFVFIAFASVSFVTKSGAFDGLVVALMKVFKGNSSLIVIPIFMALFGLGSSTVGMFEEWLAFIPIFAAIFIGLGYDAIVGLAVVALGAGMGFSGATLNPFTVGVAQGIAEVDYMHGVGFRILCHVAMLAVAAAFVMVYAAKVKKDPTKSLVYGDDFSAILSGDGDVTEREFGTRQILVLIDLLIAIAVVVWGVKTKGWYFSELSAVFMIMGIVAAIIMGSGLNAIGEQFAEGFKEAAMASMMICIARGVLMVLNAGNVVDTIVYGLSLPLSHLPVWLSAIAMLIMQTILNFFIPSGSGQAAVSMPIMAPMADLLGLSRDTAVLAYQFGDGLSNIVWPTAFAAVMSGLACVKLSKWWRFIFPVFIAIIGVQAILMVIAVATGL